MPRVLDLNIRMSIIEMNFNGYSKSQIASELGICTQTVSKWIKRYQIEGNVESHYSNCSPPTILGIADQEAVLLSSIENPFKSSVKIKEELDLMVTPQLINLRLRQNGLKSHHSAKKVAMKPRNREVRIEWCLFYRLEIDSTKAIFVDECSFSSEKDGIRLVKRPRDHRFTTRYVNHSDHCGRQIVNMWGALTFNGLQKLVDLGQERLNMHSYVELLSTIGVEIIRLNFGNNLCFWLEDNCPAHRSRMVEQWFEDCNALYQINVKLIKLPAYSPDLNIIENVWGNLKHDLLYDNETPTTRNAMKTKIIQKWDIRKQDETYMKQAFLSMEERLEKIIQNDGYPIKY